MTNPDKVNVKFLSEILCVCISRKRESCVLHNLSRLQEMQARLQVNLEAIAVLNQQVRSHTHTHQLLLGL